MAALPASISQITKRWSESERIRDSSVTCDNECPLSSNDIYEKFAADFVTIYEFEKYYKEISRVCQQLISENEEIRKKNSYLESIVMKYFFENVNKTSHENATQLREFFQLPIISEKAKKSIIFELDGILEDMGNEKKSSKELLMEIRGE
jgi:hypothetical protein